MRMNHRITEDDLKFMQLAIDISLENIDKGNGGPFGAVIVKNGKIIARSGNNVLSANDPTAHAEIEAIRKACDKLNDFQLENCTIYCSCEPCPMCLGAIYWARPSKVFYANARKDAANIGFDDEFIYDEMEKQVEERRFPFIRIMKNEALQAFKKWEEKGDKKLY